METPIYVTKPYLPDLKDFTVYLEKIWESKILTNDGPFHQELEEKLADYLGVKYVSLFSNGTLALITALQTLRISGEVITTPFSFAATTHSIFWNGLKPVFCDIEPKTFTIDPSKIERCITAQTKAILPVHVYGNPCKVEAIEEVASKHGLNVIYDAAHAFGVRYKKQSILNFGDLSILSFHATKIYNTFEGGAIICHDEKTKRRIDFLKNHGFSDEITIVTPGINAKMNEVQAAMGLLQLKSIDERLAKLKVISLAYQSRLCDTAGIRLPFELENVSHNHSYFPIVVDEAEFGLSRDELYEKLKEENIYTRRYFYPLISEFPAYQGLPSARKTNLPVANKMATEVLCLPNFADLTIDEVDMICRSINALKVNKEQYSLISQS